MSILTIMYGLPTQSRARTSAADHGLAREASHVAGLPARSVAGNQSLVRRASAAQSPPLLSPSRAAALQRKCLCGGTPGPDGECAACKAKRLAAEANAAQASAISSASPTSAEAGGLQRAPASCGGPAVAPPIVHSVLQSAGRPL